MRIYLYPQESCAISVVIPMYNVESYIAECLDSLLIQTFQDFEVIVVDDCSTDNSAEIIGSYAPKFNGRLRIASTGKNSGGGGYVPRSVGFKMARGKYIQFLDSDDLLLGSALETLYNLAEEYQADVVYTGYYYRLNAPDDISLYRDGVNKNFLKENREDKIELTVDDPNKNLDRLFFTGVEGNFHNCRSKFVRREFLLENKITFPIVSNAGDFVWAINVYCHAKRFLRIPTPLYIYRRYNENSILRKKRAAQEQLLHWLSSFVDFAKNIHELEMQNEVLSNNPDYCLAALKKHFRFLRTRIEYAQKELDSGEIYKILRREFVKNFPDYTALLLPFLFSSIDNAQIPEKFKPYITARIDIKLMTAAGNFEIVSVSEDKAKVNKPAWIQKNGVGYVITSYQGNLEFVAKSAVDGQINLQLRGLDVRTKEDKSKRIPYWIDYEKLIINDEIIFDTVTPSWHDKPYKCNFNVKAGEEIKICVEWLPHRSDT